MGRQDGGQGHSTTDARSAAVGSKDRTTFSKGWKTYGLPRPDVGNRQDAICGAFRPT